MVISIDNVSLVMRVKTEVWDERINESIKVLDNLLNWIDRNLKFESILSSSPYPRQYVLRDGMGSMSFTNDFKAVLWHFNPNTIQLDYELFKDEFKRLFVDVLYFLETENDYFTRIDLAVDLDMNINDYLFKLDGSSKKCVYYGSSGTETIYLGSRESMSMFRIYNKRLQGGDLAHTQSYKNTTRIELEFKPQRYKKGDNETMLEYNDKVENLNLLDEQFKKLCIIKRSSHLDYLRTITDINSAILVDYFILNNDKIDLLKEFGNTKASKLNKLLKQLKDETLENNINLMFKLDHIKERLLSFRKYKSIEDLFVNCVNF